MLSIVVADCRSDAVLASSFSDFCLVLWGVVVVFPTFGPI